MFIILEDFFSDVRTHTETDINTHLCITQEELVKYEDIHIHILIMKARGAC